MSQITSMAPGQSIAHYKILSKLGEGGMGEVWRATDTKLSRDVAIKILPAAFSADPDRMARFTREAQVLARLNHPNIAAIYGVEERALVLELVEGENVRGPLPLETAILYARQIAEALEAAHEKGIVHRDLKPANIKVTPEGTVKVLDFGLAKPAETAPVASPEDSPTLSLSQTRSGIILGTAGYMSPEQADGKPVDKRADIWSFGVVLWEMLTGRQLFQGETISQTLADVLRAPIDLGPLPRNTPPGLRSLISRCLDRDVKKRLRDIGEARILLESRLAPTPDAEVAPRSPSVLPWIIAAVLFASTAVLAFLQFRQTQPESPVIRSFIPAPRDAVYNFPDLLSNAGPVAVSPDGRLLTFSAKAVDGKSQLWLRPLDALIAQPLPGTENGIHPFWSPDSRFVGFFTGGKLKKIDTTGGPPVTLCDAPNGRGGTWNAEGVIVFNPHGIGSGLDRVSASGGLPVPLNLDVDGRWPGFLPDGQHFLYSANSAIRLGSLGSKQTTLLVETRSDAVYAHGQVLYLIENTLVARPFDLKRLAFSGEAVPIAENVNGIGSQRRGVFSVSQNGILAYQTAAPGIPSQLTWLDRSGKRIGTLGAPGHFSHVELSHDGKRVVACILDPATRTFDLWIYDVARELKTRFTFDNASQSLPAIWSPDGASIAFMARRKDRVGIYRKAANLSGDEELLRAENSPLVPFDWSPDGKKVLYNLTGVGSFALPIDGDHTPTPAPVRNAFSRYSPDGQWIAYVSGDFTPSEIIVTRASSRSARVQISINGGSQPRWRSDGKEIFYTAMDGRVMAAEVKVSLTSLEVTRVQPLFGGASTDGPRNAYDVAPGGQRFLAILPTAQQPTSEPLTLVQNWTAALKK